MSTAFIFRNIQEDMPIFATSFTTQVMQQKCCMLLQGHSWLTVFVRESLSEIRRLVRQHDRLLRKIAADTRHIRKSHGIDAPESILETDEPSQSIFSQLIETQNEKEADFETVILRTKVYSNAFVSVLDTTSSNNDQSDEVQTIVSAETGSPALPAYLVDLENIMQKVEFKDMGSSHWSKFDVPNTPLKGASAQRKVVTTEYPTSPASYILPRNDDDRGRSPSGARTSSIYKQIDRSRSPDYRSVMSLDDSELENELDSLPASRETRWEQMYVDGDTKLVQRGGADIVMHDFATQEPKDIYITTPPEFMT